MANKALAGAVCICLLVSLLGVAAAAGDAPRPELTLRQKIMQKIMLSVRNWSDNPSPTPEERKAFPAFTQMNDRVLGFLSAYQPGGMILFAPNTPDTATTMALIDAMQSALREAGAPRLLIGIDQEGGRITRLGEGTSLPGNMALGAISSPEAAYQTGQILGSELFALGINMDFAPALDVNNNPQNPVINVRSFGESPQKVAELGIQLARGLADAGVLPVIKHFPGHGDTQTDSHVALPRVDKDKAALLAMELLPFQAAIDDGIRVVMSAHIQYPALDDTRVISKKTGEGILLPATLSPRILTGVLRGEMGFDGVIITDAMNMDAIAAHFGIGEAMVRAFEAGVDLALMPIEIACPEDIKTFEEAVIEVEGAVAEGRLPEKDLDESLARIMALKAGLAPLADRPLEERIKAAETIVGSAGHKAAERQMAAKSLTLLRGQDTLPLKPREGQQVLITGTSQAEVTALRFGIERLMREGKLPQIHLVTYLYTEKNAPDEAFMALVAESDYAILTSRIATAEQLKKGQWQSDFPLAASALFDERGIPYGVLSLLLPQDGALIQSAPIMMMLYNPVGMSDKAYQNQRYAFGPNLPAAMDVLFGDAKPQGKLPVTLYALDENRNISPEQVLYPVGFGLNESKP